MNAQKGPSVLLLEMEAIGACVRLAKLGNSAKKVMKQKYYDDYYFSS